MYKLQWTKISENGKAIPVENFVFEDANDMRFDDYDKAMQERIQVMLRNPGKYVRVVEV